MTDDKSTAEKWQAFVDATRDVGTTAEQAARSVNAFADWWEENTVPIPDEKRISRDIWREIRCAITYQNFHLL